MATLYELTANYRALQELAESGEVDAELLKDTFEAIGGEIEDKAENTAKIIALLKADADAVSAEIDRLAARKKAFENNAARLKDNLTAAMQATGKTKFKTTLYSFNIQKNAAKLIIDDESKVPAIYLIEQQPKIDNKAIKDAIKETGACEYAHLEQSESLRIR